MNVTPRTHQKINRTRPSLDSLAPQSRFSNAAKRSGIEGAATANWYRHFRMAIKRPWTFKSRNRRPPKDPVNSLLGLAAMLALEKTIAMTTAFGFEVNSGSLHEFVPGRPSLACDLLEPLRMDAVDRWVLRFTQSNTITVKDFKNENGGCRLCKSVFGKTIASWEQNWQDHEIGNQLLSVLRECESLIRGKTG